MCLVASVTYIVLVYFGRSCLVCDCVCYLYRSCVSYATSFGVIVSVTHIVLVFFGEKKMVQCIMEAVAEYEDRLLKM